MKRLYSLLLILFAGFAFAMTSDDFQKLYSTYNKDAETCYKIYKAYAEGDGVEKNESHARKWLLAAHACGKPGLQKEIAELPWRSAPPYKSERSIEITYPDDEKARQKGLKLLDFLVSKYGISNISGINISGIDKEKIISDGDLETVKKYIANGADLNVYHEYQNKKSHYSFSALSLACRNGDTRLAKLLIDHGADPCANSMLAMEHSLCSRSILKKINTPTRIKLSDKMLKFLIKNGLDLHMWTLYGASPAHLVAGLLDAVDNIPLLVKAGMDVNQRANRKEIIFSATPCPAGWSTYGGMKDEERALYLCLRRSSDGRFGVLEIHTAHLSIQALLKQGADALSPLPDGRPLYQYAEEMRTTHATLKPRIVDMLRKAHDKQSKTKAQ